MTAERNRRAIVEDSIGKKQSLVNTSEGLKSEMVNVSEGEKQKRINEAQGLASEILALGKATAESIEKVASAINGPGGKDAVKLELGQKYIQTLAKLSKGENKVILSSNLTNMNEVLKAMELDV